MQRFARSVLVAVLAFSGLISCRALSVAKEMARHSELLTQKKVQELKGHLETGEFGDAMEDFFGYKNYYPELPKWIVYLRKDRPLVQALWYKGKDVKFLPDEDFIWVFLFSDHALGKVELPKELRQPSSAESNEISMADYYKALKLRADIFSLLKSTAGFAATLDSTSTANLLRISTPTLRTKEPITGEDPCQALMRRSCAADESAAREGPINPSGCTQRPFCCGPGNTPRHIPSCEYGMSVLKHEQMRDLASFGKYLAGAVNSAYTGVFTRIQEDEPTKEEERFSIVTTTLTLSRVSHEEGDELYVGLGRANLRRDAVNRLTLHPQPGDLAFQGTLVRSIVTNVTNGGGRFGVSLSGGGAFNSRSHKIDTQGATRTNLMLLGHFYIARPGAHSDWPSLSLAGGTPVFGDQFLEEFFSGLTIGHPWGYSFGISVGTQWEKVDRDPRPDSKRLIYKPAFFTGLNVFF